LKKKLDRFTPYLRKGRGVQFNVANVAHAHVCGTRACVALAHARVCLQNMTRAHVKM